MNNRSTVVLMLFAAAMSDAANAVPILPNAVAIQPVSVVATTTLSTLYVAANTIDKVSLSANYISGITAASAIDGINPIDDQKGWQGINGVKQGSITFGLGSSYTLDRVFLFWTNNGDKNNIANFNIDVSADDSFFSFVTAAFFSSPTPGKAIDRVDFTSLATGKFVRLNWTALQGSYPGLKEFVAGGVPLSVPEPASLALLGIGLAGLGAMRRNRA